MSRSGWSALCRGEPSRGAVAGLQKGSDQSERLLAQGQMFRSLLLGQVCRFAPHQVEVFPTRSEHFAEPCTRKQLQTDRVRRALIGMVVQGRAEAL